MALLFCLPLLVTAGCPGSSTQSGGGGKEQIKDLVWNMSDQAANPENFKSMFSGSPPADATRYQQLSFYPKEVSVSGDTATIVVSIKKNDATEQKLEDMQWKAVKEGDQWKLSEAPLPP